MRLLHTSDWHVGKLNYRITREADHDRVFQQMLQIAKDEAVDLIVHTGDLYDKEEHPPDVLRRGISYIEELATVAPVIVVVGNHDSDGYFNVFDALIGRRRPAVFPIHFFHRARLKLPSYGMLTLASRNEKERIRVGCIPFVRQASYVNAMLAQPDSPVGLVYADQLGRLEQAVHGVLNEDYNPNTDIRMFAAHLLVDGVTIGGPDRGERRLDVEFDAFGTRPDSIPTADYLAFGHIHKPQVVPGKINGRYAGSPLAVDFGEAQEEKGVYVVELRPGLPPREEDIRFIRLDVGRELVNATIPWDELPEKGPALSGKIVKLTLIRSGSERNVDDYVREHLGGAALAKINDEWTQDESREGNATPLDTGPEKTLPQLFVNYLESNPGLRQTELSAQYFERLYKAVEADQPAQLEELDAL